MDHVRHALEVDDQERPVGAARPGEAPGGRAHRQDGEPRLAYLSGRSDGSSVNQIRLEYTLNDTLFPTILHKN